MDIKTPGRQPRRAPRPESYRGPDQRRPDAKGADQSVMDQKMNSGELALMVNGPWDWANLRKSGVVQSDRYQALAAIQEDRSSVFFRQ